MAALLVLPGETAKPQAAGRLGDWHATGDGLADDTAALRRALAEVAGGCLDGEGRQYRISGTIEVVGNLCLKRARLVQRAPGFDVRPFLRGDCPVVSDPAARVDCGDLVVPEERRGDFVRNAYLRSLFVHPRAGGAPVRVVLEDVAIDRGDDPAAGSRTDAAGLWIEGADGVELRGVSVTGAGRGHGVMIAHSRNVSIDRLDVHDLVWAPYPGELASYGTIRRQGWNRVTLREPELAAGAARSFSGVRVQEQLACVSVIGSRHVRISRLRIAGCEARLAEGRVAWQADGLDIGGGSGDFRVRDAKIDRTWEGIDVVGTGVGVQQVTLTDVIVSNTFSIAVKWGYRTDDIALSRARIDRAGLAGMAIYGPVRNARVSGVRISGVGSVMIDGRSQAPWGGVRAGILVDGQPDGKGGVAAPSGLVIGNVSVAGNDCAAGIANRTDGAIGVAGFRASGCRQERLGRF